MRKNNTVIKNNKRLKIVLYWAVCLVEGIKPLPSLQQFYYNFFFEILVQNFLKVNKYKILNYYYRDKGPTHILDLGFGREHEQSDEERIAMSSSNSGPNEQNTKWKSNLRRNISSDMMITAQTCTPAIMATFQETLVKRTCIINV